MSTKSVQADTSKISTLRLGAVLKDVYFPENNEELLKIYAKIGDKQPTVLGGISNTLVVEDTNEPVIMTSLLKEIIISNNYLDWI